MTPRFGFGLLTLLIAVPAGAHLDLISPTARLKGEDGGSQLKTKPCGQTANKRTTDKVTTFTPGQKVDVKIKEYINHPGYFAVAFDPDGDDSFVFPRENADKVVAASDDPKTLFPVDGMQILGLRTDKEKDCYTEATDNSHECVISITIPNMTCQSCTLQVTQFMYDKLGDNADNEYYYQCADIKIEGTATGGAGGSAAGGSAAGGSGAAAGAASGTGGTGGATSGGAGTSSGGTGAATAGAAAGGAATGGTPTSAGGSSTAGTATASAGTATTLPPAGEGPAESDGCGMAPGRGRAGPLALAALGLLLARARRRRGSV